MGDLDRYADLFWCSIFLAGSCCRNGWTSRKEKLQGDPENFGSPGRSGDSTGLERWRNTRGAWRWSAWRGLPRRRGGRQLLQPWSKVVDQSLSLLWAWRLLQSKRGRIAEKLPRCWRRRECRTCCTEKSKLTLNVVVRGPSCGKRHC